MTPGQRIGHYRILQRIGGGGMGEVFLARRGGAAGVESEVALKVIRADRASDAREVQRLEREARALVALSHRAVIKVFELYDDGQRLYLAMEYLRGVDLRTLMQRRAGPLPWAAATFIGAEVAHALAAAHGLRTTDAPNGLVHRDLSPSNVMACRDGSVKLLDFGLARPVGHEQSVSGIEGKLRYLAPEVASGVAPSPSVDVYALGTVLYELVCGKPAFDGENELELLNRILFSEAPPPSHHRPDLPEALDYVLCRAMARDQGQRYSANQLARRLELLTAGSFGPRDLADLVASAQQGTEHTTTEVPTAASVFQRRSPARTGQAARIGLVLAGSLALAALAAVWAFTGRPPTQPSREPGRPERANRPSASPAAPEPRRPARDARASRDGGEKPVSGAISATVDPPAGARVEIDGHVVEAVGGRSTLQGLSPGQHVVEVTRAGREPIRRVVEVPPGGTVELVFTLSSSRPGARAQPRGARPRTRARRAARPRKAREGTLRARAPAPERVPIGDDDEQPIDPFNPP